MADGADEGAAPPPEAARSDSPQVGARARLAERLETVRRAFDRRVWTPFCARFSDGVDLLAVGVIVLVMALAAARGSLFFDGKVLAASIVAPALCFLLASRALRRVDSMGPERSFYALAAMVAGLWLFETVADQAWPNSWGQIPKSLQHFNTNLPHPGGQFPLLWAAIMIAVAFVGYPFMRAGRPFLVVLAASVSVLALWMAAGLPTHDTPWLAPSQTDVLHLIPPEYAHPASAAAPGWNFIVGWGTLFETAAKLVWGLLPGLLYAHHLRCLPSPTADRPDDLIVKARRALTRKLFRGRAPTAPAAPATSGDAAAPAGVRARAAARVKALAAYLEPRISDIADLAMVGVILVAIALSLRNQSFIAVPPQLLSTSLIGYALAFLITSRSLRRHKELRARRMFISLGALASSVWLFEIIWHYWGFDVWYKAPQGLFSLSLDTTAQPFPLTWGLIVFALVFTGARYMKANLWIPLTLIAAILTFEVWKAAGWPLFPVPERWPQGTPRWDIIPREFFHPTTPEARAVVIFWGATLNSITKLFWCALPGTFFLTRENFGGPIRRVLWPPGPALKSLLMPWKEWRALRAPQAGAAPNALARPPAPAGQPSAPSSAGGAAPR